MSHAAAEIIHNGAIIGHSEYNGVVDVMQWNSWYNTFDEMWSHYRIIRPFLDHCSCPGVDALIYTSYGGGFYWPARVCIEHKIILHGLVPWDEVKETSPIDGHPLGHKHPLETAQ